MMMRFLGTIYRSEEGSRVGLTDCFGGNGAQSYPYQPTDRPVDGQNLFKWPATSLQYNITPYHYNISYHHHIYIRCLTHQATSAEHPTYLALHQTILLFSPFGVHIWEGPHCNYGTAPLPKTWALHLLSEDKNLKWPFQKTHNHTGHLERSVVLTNFWGTTLKIMFDKLGFRWLYTRSLAAFHALTSGPMTSGFVLGPHIMHA